MINRIEMEVNNGRIIQLAQQQIDGNITLTTYNKKSALVDHEQNISASDMVMLINYYRYIKDNNIQCDFINPNGELTQAD